MPVENPATHDDAIEVHRLARKLADVQAEVSVLCRTRDAMLAADRLVKHALHYGYAARGDDLKGEAIYNDGVEVLSHLAGQLAREVIAVQCAFIGAVKGDAVVGAALDAIHKARPLSEIWTDEPYPAPE